HLGASSFSWLVQVTTLRTCLFARGGAGAADSGGLPACRVPAILASRRRAGDLDFAGTVDMPEGGTGKTPLVARVVDSTLRGRTAGAQTRSRGDQSAPRSVGDQTPLTARTATYVTSHHALFPITAPQHPPLTLIRRLFKTPKENNGAVNAKGEESEGTKVVEKPEKRSQVYRAASGSGRFEEEAGTARRRQQQAPPKISAARRLYAAVVFQAKKKAGACIAIGARRPRPESEPIARLALQRVQRVRFAGQKGGGECA
ncbi:hypothetical protein MRX96_052337, partial [Rhipicephalus microplus]